MGCLFVYAFGRCHIAGVCDPTIHHTSLYHKFQTDKIITPLAQPAGNGRCFAGEATADDSNPLMVHGAIAHGWRAAQAVFSPKQ